MSNVVGIGAITKLDVPSEKVLRAAEEACVQDVLVAGFTPDGDFYLASAPSDVGYLLYILERAKMTIMSQEDAQ